MEMQTPETSFAPVHSLFSTVRSHSSGEEEAAAAVRTQKMRGIVVLDCNMLNSRGLEFHQVVGNDDYIDRAGMSTLQLVGLQIIYTLIFSVGMYIAECYEPSLDKKFTSLA